MALSSAIAIPAAVAAIWWFATGTDTGLNQISHLAGNVIIGGMIAAVVVYRHKAMPLAGQSCWSCGCTAAVGCPLNLGLGARLGAT